MNSNPDQDKPGISAKGPRKPSAADAREARLKAALKANMARRKAQARARSAVQPDEPGKEKG